MDGRLHSFRHFFCSASANAGVPERVLMDWLGHRSIHMVHRNIHLHNEESHRQMARWSRLEATVQTHCEPEAVRSSEKTQPLNILGNPPQVLSRTRSDWHSPTVPIRFLNATHSANGSGSSGNPGRSETTPCDTHSMSCNKRWKPLRIAVSPVTSPEHRKSHGSYRMSAVPSGEAGMCVRPVRRLRFRPPST